MGDVWLAYDGLQRLDVVLRAIPWVPPADTGGQESRRERAIREAGVLARLDHPNIAGVLDLAEDDGQPWMVFEAAPYRFPGRPLGDIVRADGPLPPEQAAGIGWQVLAALRQAHAVGVLHRDVKPGSVLLGPGNQVMLADFGMVTADGSPALTTPEELTGSPLYMAPERARGEPATPAADLWSLGASLYAAVEGRAPFHRDGAAAVLAAILNGTPDLPEHAGPLWPVISGLLRKDPGARPDAAGADWLLRRVAGRHRPALPPPPVRIAPQAVDAATVPGGDAQTDPDGPAVTDTVAPPSPVAVPGDAAAPADFVPGFGPREQVPAAAEPAVPRPRRRWRIATGVGRPGSSTG